ncbi:hypothetical protein ACQBAR_15620 [Propionibacteriaceae bacterium Y1685]|uniref:hypothetical protein n=1 Tax=Microlunatus sp. Y1700 TaxID=3418487 RepID=UPI003B799715
MSMNIAGRQGVGYALAAAGTGLVATVISTVGILFAPNVMVLAAAASLVPAVLVATLLIISGRTVAGRVLGGLLVLAAGVAGLIAPSLLPSVAVMARQLDAPEAPRAAVVAMGVGLCLVVVTGWGLARRPGVTWALVGLPIALVLGAASVTVLTLPSARLPARLVAPFPTLAMIITVTVAVVVGWLVSRSPRQ